ncbi:MAG: hypothetical protein ACREBC_36565 [Pyrinomonadaceae bacterium]
MIKHAQEHPVPPTQLSDPINFVKLDRVREAFEVNLTVASESERLAATQLARHALPGFGLGLQMHSVRRRAIRIRDSPEKTGNGRGMHFNDYIRNEAVSLACITRTAPSFGASMRQNAVPRCSSNQ